MIKLSVENERYLITVSIVKVCVLKMHTFKGVLVVLL